MAAQAERLEEQNAWAARMAQAKDDEAKAIADVIRMEAERARLCQTRVGEAAIAANVNVGPSIQLDKFAEVVGTQLGMLDEVVLQGAGVSKVHVQTFSEQFAFLMGLAAAVASLAAPGQAAPVEMQLQPQPPRQAGGAPSAVAAGSAAAPAASPVEQVQPTVPDSDDGMGEDDLSGQEAFDKMLAAVDLTGDPGEIRQRMQEQWREAHRKMSRLTK